MSNQYISYDVTKTLSKLLIQFLEGNPDMYLRDHHICPRLGNQELPTKPIISPLLTC